jgi:hypothetical protein
VAWAMMSAAAQNASGQNGVEEEISVNLKFSPQTGGVNLSFTPHETNFVGAGLLNDSVGS